MTLGKEEIKKILPHRNDMLLVDDVTEEDGVATGHYHVTGDEFFLNGHFPGNPIVPGVVLVESMAQVAGAGIVARGALAATPGKEAVFILASVESARFRKPVRPGDKMTTVAENVKVGSKLGVFSMKGYVNGEVACDCTVKCMLGEK